MRRALILALLGTAAAAMTACSGTKEVATTAAAAAPAPTAATAPATAADNSYVASGPIIVENQVDVASQREGVVAELLADTGSSVRKGQLLAKLDDRQVSADLEAASSRTRSIEANLKNWEAESKVLDVDYQRAQKMWDAQLITKEQLDHAKYKAEADKFEIERERESLNQARATQRSLELERDKTRITAPFNGIVARRYVRVGQKVAVGDRIFWVTATAPLLVKFTLPEKFVGRVKNGEAVTVAAADQSPEMKHPAKIVQVSPVVDPSSGTIEIEAEVTGAAPDLRPGMQANVHIQARQ